MVDTELDTAFTLIQDGSFSEALPLIEGVISEDPEHWNAIFLAGICCRSIGDLDRAIEFQKRSISLNGDFPDSWLALGISLQLKEEFSDAIIALKEALKLDPTMFEGYNSLGMIYNKMDNLDKALNNFDKAGNVLIDEAQAESKRRGYITWKKSDDGKTAYFVTEESYTFVEGYLRKDKKYASAMFNLGNIYFAMGDHESAKDSLIESIDFTPDGASSEPAYEGLKAMGIEYTP
jgi:tetratricopeptide (TPR) repeat protein